MKKNDLDLFVAKFKANTKDALQTLYDNIPKGQQKQLIKKEEIKYLFDKYEVNYER